MPFKKIDLNRPRVAFSFMSISCGFFLSSLSFVLALRLFQRADAGAAARVVILRTLPRLDVY
jgi:hypothetical protein